MGDAFVHNAKEYSSWANNLYISSFHIPCAIFPYQHSIITTNQPRLYGLDPYSLILPSSSSSSLPALVMNFPFPNTNEPPISLRSNVERWTSLVFVESSYHAGMAMLVLYKHKLQRSHDSPNIIYRNPNSEITLCLDSYFSRVQRGEIEKHVRVYLPRIRPDF